VTSPGGGYALPGLQNMVLWDKAMKNVSVDKQLKAAPWSGWKSLRRFL